MFITVFTASFNRVQTLPRLFESLKKQRFNDFEWLIVDDGSSDQTKKLVDGFRKNCEFRIAYHYQKNSGKYVAINRGLDEAQGKLFFILDSDDYLLDNVLESIFTIYKSIGNDRRFAGLAGRKVSIDMKLIGTPLKKEAINSSTLDLRLKHGIKGDLAEVFLTSVIGKFRFPEIEGERYFAPSFLYNKVSEKHIIHYTSEIFSVCEYLPDGLTAQNVRLRHQSPTCATIYYKTYATYKIGVLGKIKAYTNFWRFSLSRQERFSKMLGEVPKLSIFFIPLALVIRVFDHKKQTGAKNLIFS